MNLSQKKRQRMLEFLARIRNEHKDDDETLIAINEIESELNSKKYGLVWEKHEETVDVQMRTHIPVFTEDKTKEIETLLGEDYNFILEGDNLHSLYLLEKTHKGRIGFIYIDPPYNTGNKDFIYDDKYIDSIDGYKHSKWVSFMSNRLYIARRLLCRTGIICISIDDNELATLILLCNDIFGEANFIGNVIIKSNPRGSQSKKEIASLHEYVLLYAKDSEYASIIGHELTEEMQSEYKYIDEIGNYRLLGLRQRGGFWRASERPNLFYPFYINPNDSTISLSKDFVHVIEAWPYQPTSGEKGTWRWSKEKALLNLKKLVAKKVKRKDEIIWDIYQKDYLNHNEASRRTKAKSIWDEKEMNYQNAANELKDIFCRSPFNYAKPTFLIKRCLEMVDISENNIALDFFAGSGTTAQAVLELNKQDGGHRKFILCTNNENNICTEVTYPRVKTVITGKREDGSTYSEGIPANLKYFRTDFVARDEEYLSDALLDHVKEMIELENGIKIDNRKYVIILDEEEADELEKKWVEYKELKAIYVSSEVLFTTKQSKIFASKEIYTIPDYYFEFELRQEEGML